MTNWLPCVILMGVSHIDLMKVNSGAVEEVCQSEVFKARCPTDHVITMETARYGRMQINRCVETDLGYLECRADVLSITDRGCSGNQVCDIRVPNAEMDSLLESGNEGKVPKRCPKDVSRYLEASYSCHKALRLNTVECNSPRTIHTTSIPSVLSSKVINDTGCGSNSLPWILEAQKGQRININLVDFWWTNNSGNFRDCRIIYGQVTDVTSGKRTTICGGGERIRNVMMSTGHKVEINLNADPLRQRNFLLRYEVQGCPDLLAPAQGWIRRHGNETTAGCQSSKHTWHLYCHGNKWIGVIGNCTQYEVMLHRLIMEDDSYSSVPSGAIIFIVLVVAIILCGSILFLGFFCFQRLASRDYITSGGDCDSQECFFTLPKSNTCMESKRESNPKTTSSTYNKSMYSQHFEIYPASSDGISSAYERCLTPCFDRSEGRQTVHLPVKPVCQLHGVVT